ncbi:hypothetical protein BDR07DRAFT_1482050 [Suillus spraguei]|nr:hypothetical protein BDR07DRAFT_1482050 [Suillus spraguei]
MSVDNIDIDMQCPKFQPEDVQTSYDGDLFGDNEDDNQGAGDFMDALSQPPTSVVRLDNWARDEVMSGKCRFHEVNYSQTLCQTVYEQQEHINNIIQETEVLKTTLRSNDILHKMSEKQEIHAWQEQQQPLLRKNIAEELTWHEVKISARKDQELAEELARHNTELNTRKNQELEECEKAIFAEMEQRLQLEIEKLKVEKENELTSMEQRFTRHGRQQHAAMEMDTDPTRRNTQQLPQMPQKPQIKTPCLETIKKIRKVHGITRKMHLISVVEDADADDPMEGEIWRLLKDTFSISQDADFIVHQPVDHEDVYSYEYKDGPAPNTQNLAFDLKHGPKTPWNAKILDILLGKLEKRSVEEEWSFRRSDDYYKAILEDCYKQLWTIWRAAQPKGILETVAEGRG